MLTLVCEFTFKSSSSLVFLCRNGGLQGACHVKSLIQWSLTITRVTCRGVAVSRMFLVRFFVCLFFLQSMNTHCVLLPDWTVDHCQSVSSVSCLLYSLPLTYQISSNVGWCCSVSLKCCMFTRTNTPPPRPSVEKDTTAEQDTEEL